MAHSPPAIARRRRVLYAARSESPGTLAGIRRYAQRAGWIVDWGVHNISLHGKLVRWDGVITRLDPASEDLLRFVAQARVPVVDVGRDSMDVAVPRVLLDDMAIGSSGAQHLIERGFRNLAFFMEGADPAVCLRREGFAAAVRRASRRFYLMAIRPELSWRTPSTGDYERLIAALRSSPMPLGIMAGADAWALALVNACLMAGLRIPEHVAVMGADNEADAAEFAAVPISCVIATHNQHGYEAAALLDRLMHGAPQPRAPLLVAPAGVAARRSTDTVAVNHDGIARAVRFILEQFRSAISVEEVARAAVMSPSHLFREFPRYTGRTVHEMINLQRIEHACGLLRDTDKPMDLIAESAGFADARRMAKVFTRELHCTPRDYRRTHAAQR